MIGGYLTFSGVDAKGKWHDTAVQDAPVEVLTVDDRMEHCDGISPVVVKDHVSLKGMPEKWPDVLGYNKTIPKPEAEVAVIIGDDPLVAFSEYGKGKSACYLVGLRAALGAAGVLRMGRIHKNLEGYHGLADKVTGTNGGSEDEALQ